MNILPLEKERGITVVVGLPDQKPLLEVITQLALQAHIRVIVGGNRFDAHQLARIIRRHTVHVDQTLERIHLARPFTCYQVLTLLEQPQATTPLVVLDMLSTFYDDNISKADSIRLVRTAVTHMCQFGELVPILVTLRPPPTPERQELTELIQDAADYVYIYDPPRTPVQPSLL